LVLKDSEVLLTFSVCGSHICDTAWRDFPHSIYM